jgi:glycosyltransferase involved in cell wall biosynthesis
MSAPVALVLPELSPDAATHYSHYVSLIRELARLTQVALVVERAAMGDEAQLAALLPGVEVHVQRQTAAPLRALELMRLLGTLRRRGYRHAYGSYSPFFGVAGGLAGRVLGVRTSYWHCRSDFFDTRIAKRLTVRRMLTDTVPMLLSLRLAHQVVTGTPGLADLYARTFRLRRGRIRVVPNEIDAAAFAPPAPRAPGCTVLFVGRLSEHKGARLLPEIATAVLDAEPEARFVIAGGGPDEELVRSALAGEPRVELLGYVPNPEVPALMHDADVLVMPSLEEGFPRRLLEAMAAGLPFVATDVGGVREVIPAAAREYVVASGDPQAAADAVLALLRDPARRDALSAAGMAHVARYAVDRVAPQFLAAVTG